MSFTELKYFERELWENINTSIKKKSLKKDGNMNYYKKPI